MLNKKQRNRELILGYINGEPELTKEFRNRYSEYIFNKAIWYSGNIEESEDWRQEIFLKLYLRLKKSKLSKPNSVVKKYINQEFCVLRRKWNQALTNKFNSASMECFYDIAQLDISPLGRDEYYQKYYNKKDVKGVIIKKEDLHKLLKAEDQERFTSDYNDIYLYELFLIKYGTIKKCPLCDKDTNYHRVRGRACFECQWCGNQLYPKVGTIFQKSTTHLHLWFCVIYLMVFNRQCFSIVDTQKQLGVGYKTTWRMVDLIRKLDAQTKKKYINIVKNHEIFKKEKYGKCRKCKRIFRIFPWQHSSLHWCPKCQSSSMYQDTSLYKKYIAKYKRREE